MNCPNCGRENYCSCRSCLPRNEGKLLEVWLSTEIAVVACGNCGFSMIDDAWSEMSMKLIGDKVTRDGVTTGEGPNESEQRDIYAHYLAEGRMPGDPGYGVSFRAHWTVRLWRWRGIVGHTIEMLLGRSMAYRKGSKWLTFKDQMAKF